MTRHFELRYFRRSDGHVPLADWLEDLDDRTVFRIKAHIDRIETGNFGASRAVGNGIMELKIDMGPGYRVYYLRDGDAIVVLLCGGDKGSQLRDIRRALVLAGEYRRSQ